MVKSSLRKNKNKTTLDQRPFFNKIFLPELTGKLMKIPAQFVRDSLKHVPDRMILDCPSGGPWGVKILKTANGVFLGDGWQKFVEDNLLQEHNFLFFGYDGAMCLTVQIFEKSGLERDYTPASRTQKEVATSCIRNLDSHSTPTHSRRALNVKNSAAIQDKIKSFISECPFFDSVIKSYNVACPFLMFIPKPFGDEHFQRAKTKIMLTNSEGKAWEVNYTFNKGRFVIVGGWRRFVRDNKLKIGDVCIFELVAEKVLQVHIL